MTGVVEWPQIVFIVGAILTGMAAGFLGAWRLLSWMNEERKEFERQMVDKRAAFEVRVTSLEERFEARLAAIEIFNAGTLVVLEHLKEFREEVKTQYDSLVRQRQLDIEGINRRLDVVHNAARMFRIHEEDNG